MKAKRVQFSDTDNTVIVRTEQLSNTQKAKGNNSINSNINNIEGNVTISHNDFSNLLELQKGYQEAQKELNERLKTSQKQIDTLLEILKNK